MPVKEKEITILNVPIDVPEGTSGEWKVERFTVSEEDIRLHNLRCSFAYGMHGREMKAGTYTKLMRGGTMVMSDTPAERWDHYDFWRMAKDHVLINGLGLGVVLAACLHKREVGIVTVVEKDPDVIKLVGKHYLGNLPEGKTLSIVNEDAFVFKPPKGVRYGAVWHDIWDNMCADNLPEMHKLHRKYGRRTDWQGSWGRWQCERQR